MSVVLVVFVPLYSLLISDFAFFVFERTKHQPHRKDFATKRYLAPVLMHFCTKSWSEMVVRWRYADLFME